MQLRNNVVVGIREKNICVFRGLGIRRRGTTFQGIDRQTVGSSYERVLCGHAGEPDLVDNLSNNRYGLLSFFGAKRLCPSYIDTVVVDRIARARSEGSDQGGSDDNVLQS